jgi:hypothetical protein
MMKASAKSYSLPALLAAVDPAALVASTQGRCKQVQTKLGIRFVKGRCVFAGMCSVAFAFAFAFAKIRCELTAMSLRSKSQGGVSNMFVETVFSPVAHKPLYSQRADMCRAAC